MLLLVAVVVSAVGGIFFGFDTGIISGAILFIPWTITNNIQGTGPLEIVTAGFVNSAGVLQTGYGISSVTWDAAGLRYEISITGESYYFDEYITVVTASGTALTPRTGSAGGDLLVYLVNSGGTQVANAFQLVTYKVAVT